MPSEVEPEKVHFWFLCEVTELRRLCVLSEQRKIQKQRQVEGMDDGLHVLGSFAKDQIALKMYYTVTSMLSFPAVYNDHDKTGFRSGLLDSENDWKQN